MIKELLVGPTIDEVLYNFKDLSPSELLMKSCKIGLLDGVKIALEKGVDLNDHYMDSNIKYMDTFMEYSEDGKTATCVSFMIGDGNEYLYECSKRGYYDIVKLLLENSVNPNSKNDVILKFTKIYSHDKVVELLKSYM